MSIDISQFHQVFFEESAEHLEEMERLLLALDMENPDIEELNAIFRAAHSIKGGSGSVGFSEMTEVTHVLENLLDKLRKEELALTTAMVDTFLEAVDVLKGQLAAHTGNGEADAALAATIMERLRYLTENHAEASHHVQEVTQSAGHTYLIEYTFSTTTDPASATRLLDMLKELGVLEVIKQPDQPTGQWQIRLTTPQTADSVLELFDFLLDRQQVKIVEENPNKTETDAYGLFEPEEQAYGLFEPTPAAAEETAYGLFVDVPAPQPPSIQEQAAENARREADRRAIDRRSAERRTQERGSETSSIRVGIDKVDQLINLVGELVITQAMLKQTSADFDPVLHERLHNGMAQLERNTRDLQESVMSIRMMPIGSVFSRFPRVVRDLAGKLSKQVDLVLVGENTELDKSLIEKIADPLTHLVRNSLDHGIETPDKRLAAGKPEKGTITLSASHQGGSIVIEVADNGAGLNREKILAKAEERGLDLSGIQSDHDVWQLIFAPGFSTAEVVTDVSGRGVGMDVVMRNITEMNGTIDISSTPGQGTRMTVRLPLTLAILDGMTVGLGGSIFVIPLNLIVETLQPLAADLKTVAGEGNLVQVRGEYLPIIALYRVFNLPSEITDPCKGILVLIEADGKKAALLVDALVGQQQVVIKSLETNFRKIPGVSGATIMGDGTVALILDVPSLIRMGQGA